MADADILTEQEIMLLNIVRQGIPLIQAVRMAGYMDIEEGLSFLEEDERGKQATHFNVQLHQASPQITRDLLTSQFYEERARSINAAEGVACLREVGKLHGLYETKLMIKEEGEGKGVEKTLNQIARMEDAHIIAELSENGQELDLLPRKIIRKPIVIDAEE